MLEIIATGSTQPKRMSITSSSNLRNLNSTGSIQITGSKRVFFQHILRCTLIHDFSSHTPGFRPHVNNIIGIHHHIFIMLHNHHGITCITKRFQGTDQTVIVPLVQTNTRLIQNIKHINELRTDLGSQTYTLAFSTRQRY